MTGVADASFPTSSSICMIFLIRAWGRGSQHPSRTSPMRCNVEQLGQPRFRQRTHDGELELSARILDEGTGRSSRMPSGPRLHVPCSSLISLSLALAS